MTPPANYNRPGLNALACRIGDYGAFFQAMLDRLSSADYPALSDLSTRDLADPAIALLDAWAVVGDILTFYQERIANEGYIRTAAERLSISELAGLVGYRLRPGVAASVYLAFTVDRPAGSMDDDAEVIIPAGTRAQSVPGPGELPQAFETSDLIMARPRWNTFGIRLGAPQTVASGSQTVYVDSVTANLKQNDPLLVWTAAGQQIVRHIDTVKPEFDKGWTVVNLQVEPPAAAPPVAAPPSLPSPFDQLTSLAPVLARPPADHPRGAAYLQRSNSETFKPESEVAPALLSELTPAAGSGIYAALANEQVTPAPVSGLNAFRVRAAPFGHNAPLKLVFNDKGAVTGSVEWPIAGSTVFGVALSIQARRGIFRRDNPPLEAGRIAASFDLIATLSVSQTAGASPVQEIASLAVTPAAPGGSVELGEWKGTGRGTFNQAGAIESLELQFQAKSGATAHRFTFTEDATGLKVAVDGEPAHALGVGQTLQYTLNNGQVTFAFVIPATAAAPSPNLITEPILRATYELPQAPDLLTLPLDAVYDQITPGSWVIVERPDSIPFPTKATKVATVSKAGYGITGRVTVLTLQDPWGDSSDLMLSSLRQLSVSAQSEELPLAQQPVTDDIAGASIELDGLYPGLKPGRWLVVEGERTDIATDQNSPPATGVHGSELVMLAGVEHNAGGPSTEPAPPLPGDKTHTTLVLSSPLSYSYKRDSAMVHGNVAKATQGQSRGEILGNGDASQAFQQFDLGQKPLTFVSSPTPEGVESTLEVRVNDLLWHEDESLLDAGPKDRVYVTRTAEDATVTVVFGDGIHGSRLASGTANVRATYRAGIGKAGNVTANQISQLATQPLGVSGVTNPQPSTGGADAESGDSARGNAGVATTALDRLVSVQDYADFSRKFAGIAKASASVLSDGTQRLVYVTIAGEDDIPIALDSDLYLNLQEAFRGLGDPDQGFDIAAREALFLVISARVTVGADYEWSSVAADIRAALLDTLSFARRDLAQPVYASEVITAIQSVAGVSWVDLEILDSVGASSIGVDLKRIAQNPTNQWVAANPARQGTDPEGKPAILSAQIAYLNPNVPDTLILNQGGA